MVQVRDEIIEVMDRVQKLSSDGTGMASIGSKWNIIKCYLNLTSLEPDFPFYSDIQ